MTKKYRRFTIKRLFLFLMIGIIIAGFTACNKKGQTTFPTDDDPLSVSASKTGPLDPNGNTLTNIVYVTNVIQVTNEIVWYVTNEIYHPGKEIYKTNFVTNKVNGGKDIILTNYVYLEREKIEWVTNVVPDEGYVSKWHKSFMYRVYAPFSGIGPEGEYKYTNVSYMDTDTLSELWKKMMRMESTKGKEFTIRNRQRKDNGSFFFFDSDANLYWSKYPNKMLKKFQHGIIIQHRCGNDTKGAYAIAGVYRLAMSTAESSKWGDDGVNLFQGYLFRHDRRTHEYDIVVLNPGHVVNGSEYGFELYNTGWNYPAGISPFLERRPEYVMSKITHVSELWKNWRPWELYDLAFQISSSSIIPK